MPRMSGSHCLAQMVAGYGVTHVFMVPAVFHGAVAEMDELGLCAISTHSELSAAYMADGYARASGRPGVCFAQSVGAANLAAGLREPYLGCSPVVAVTGGPLSETRYRYLYQEIEDLPMFEPVTKFNVRVEKVQRMPDLLRQAFRVATTGTPGPVHLEIPGRLGQGLRDEAEMEILIEEQFRHYPPYRPAPEAEHLRQAAELLRAARRPVIVAGGGVIASGAAAEVVALAERLRIPVATSLTGKGTIAEDSPLTLGVIGSYGRWGANRAVAEADLVFFIGTRAGGHVTDNWRVPRPGTPVIQLDIEPAEIGRNYPVKVGLLGDAKVGLSRLLELVNEAEPDGAWARKAQAMVQAWKDDQAAQQASNATPIRPERLCRELTSVLPADAVLVADTGHAAIWSGTMVELKHPGQRYIRCAGTLGWGFPGAIGVKCALPDRPVICFTGDGGFYYHISELETAARIGINLVVVVNNNSSLNQTKKGWETGYAGRGDCTTGRARDLWVHKDVNFARVAEEMGCVGIRVTDPNAIQGALHEALAAGRPAVVDVVSDMGAVPPEPWDK